MRDLLLEVMNLHVHLSTEEGIVQAVRGVSFDIKEKEVVAVIGESGCGKSVTAQSIMRLIDHSQCIVPDGQIIYRGIDLLQLKEKEMNNYRGKEIAMVFQDPFSSLNPTMRIGQQMVESIVHHQKIQRSQAQHLAASWLEHVGITNTDVKMQQYPHELSGGMRQRVVIAMSLVNNPKLLIADEPTTALDVTVQAQIMLLMKGLQKKLGLSILLITHDFGVVAQMAHRVIVMYAGQCVEQGRISDIFTRPRHPYTIALHASHPRLLQTQQQMNTIPGAPPNLLDPPKGCSFADRCSHTMKICCDQPPPMFSMHADHQSACWLLHPDAPNHVTTKKE